MINTFVYYQASLDAGFAGRTFYLKIEYREALLKDLSKDLNNIKMFDKGFKISVPKTITGVFDMFIIICIRRTCLVSGIAAIAYVYYSLSKVYLKTLDAE
ncbi:hypothetical protein ACJX0J_028932 [Zea mays]